MHNTLPRNIRVIYTYRWGWGREAAVSTHCICMCRRYLSPNFSSHVIQQSQRVICVLSAPPSWYILPPPYQSPTSLSPAAACRPVSVDLLPLVDRRHEGASEWQTAGARATGTGGGSERRSQCGVAEQTAVREWIRVGEDNSLALS